MLIFALAAIFAIHLSALAVRKVARGQSFLGGDLFWMATTMYLWCLTFVQATVVWPDAPIRHLALDHGWLLGGGGALVLSTLAYSKASWPPFNPLESYVDVELRE